MLSEEGRALVRLTGVRYEYTVRDSGAAQRLYHFSFVGVRVPAYLNRSSFGYIPMYTMVRGSDIYIPGTVCIYPYMFGI